MIVFKEAEAGKKDFNKIAEVYLKHKLQKGLQEKQS